MSKILVDTIDTRSGTTTLTLGSTNSGTIALGSGNVQSNFMYPAFYAYLSSSQTISNNTFTKMQCDTEELDTNGDYDNSTNYRFTPSISGKYYIYGVTTTSTDVGTSSFTMAALYKNGSQVTENVMDFRTGTGGADNTVFTSIITNFNGSSDYIELYGRINTSGAIRFRGASDAVTYFGGYRIGS